MGTLSFTATVSLDGYVNDATGDFQWSAPGDEVFDFHVERMAAVSTEVLGRRTYELMTYWEAEPPGEQWGEAEREFARRWQGIEHVVVSATLPSSAITSPRTRLIRELGLAELEGLVADAPGEVEIFGPTAAGPAIVAGLVTDFRFFVVPKMVGGGVRALPAGANLALDLLEQRAFGETVYLHYRTR